MLVVSLDSAPVRTDRPSPAHEPSGCAPAAPRTSESPGQAPRPQRTHPHRPSGPGARATTRPTRPRPTRGPRRSGPVGGRLGRYRLIERLGKGCQGQVWKAIQLEPIVETVALKLLSPALARDPRRLAQFHREAEVGAQLASPALLPIYEYGEANGLVFMTMPLVNGDPLSRVIAHRRAGARGEALPAANWWSWLDEGAYIRAMVRVLARVARGLEVAHDNAVVHRDVKPANILVDRDREDRVYLCDFGLSRDLGASRPGRAWHGTGTPLYMAPEKFVRRDCDEVRCDIYALGVTLFEAVTTAHPLPVPDDLSASDWAAYLAVTTPRRPRQVNPRLVEPLEAVILRAMDGCPSRRHASAAEFADDLDRLASGPLVGP